MYVRLAFSVAAHLEPDILIVDEVLSVGDIHFQRKCLGKMHETERAGRTVLFVSHNMSTVTSLCPRAIMLDRGRIAYDGPVSNAVLLYHGSSSVFSAARNDFASQPVPVGDEQAQLLECAVVDARGDFATEVSISESFRLRMRYRLLQDIDGTPIPNFHFMTAEGSCAFVVGPTVVDAAHRGTYVAECEIPANFMNEGTYSVSFALTTQYRSSSPLNTHFFERSAVSFNVRDPMDETVSRHGWAGPVPGVVRPRFDWNVRSVNEAMNR
jgi:lipopolysaccharide transport system ATP-binding protein